MIRSCVSECNLNGGVVPNFQRARRQSLPRNKFRGVKKDELQRRTNLYLASMTIDELYCEVLYEILHNIGCDVAYEVGQTALFSYAQDAFKISNDKHRYFMEVAEKKEAPDLMVNVEVIEAKDLKPKDSNGLSDPFVTLYLASNTTQRYNTSVKTMTLNPMWEEHFAFSKPSTSTTKCSSKVDKTSENRKAKPNAQKEPQTLLIYPESANLPDCSHPSSNNTKCSLELEPQDYVSQVEVKIEPDTVIIKNEPLHEYPEVDYNTTTVPLEFLPESTVEVSEMAITFPRSPSSGTAFCRLCLKPTNNAGMVSLTALNANSHINSKEFDTSEVDADKFAKMIKTLMPSFNFGLVYNPMMCDFCSSRLELAFKFVEEVMSSQRTIEAFKEQYGRNEEMVLCEDVIKYQSKLSDPCPPKKKRKLSKLTRKSLQSSETESASSNDGDVGDYLTSTDEPIDIVKKESFYSLEEEVKIEIDSFDVECDSFTQMETDSCASGDDYYRTVKSEPEEADDIYRDSNYQYSRFNLANNQDTDVLDDGSLVTRAKDRCLSSTPAGTIRYVKKS